MKTSAVSLLLGVSVLLLPGPTVSADPQVSLEIPALPVMAGSDVTLHCRSKDQVALEAFFIRNGSKLGSGPEGLFTVRNIQQSDEGLYWCYFDKTEESPRRWLSVRGQDTDITSYPQVSLEIPALPVMAGSDVTLHCRSKDQVALDAFFIRDGVAIGSGPEGQFTLSNINKSDEGLYWCYFDQTEESPRRRLSVRDPQVSLEIPALPVIAGSDVTLRCRSKDQVALDAFFIRDGSNIGSGPQGQFTIRNIQQSDEGLYWCYFDQTEESPRRQLSVRDPQVSLEIPALPVMAGSDVTLRCRSKDQDALEAFFIRDGSKLGSGPEGQLTLRNVQPSDEGLYWCYFDQTAESSRRRLSVRDPQVSLEIPALPVIAGSDVTLRCRSKDQDALEAFFIRDGSKLGSGPEGQFTIRNVQPSDEGLYWCYFDQTAESSRRRLSVRGN